MRKDLPELPPDTVLATIGRLATRYEDSRWLDALAMRASGGEVGARDLLLRTRENRWERLNRRDLAWFAHIVAANLNDAWSLTDVATILEHALQRPDPPRVGSRVWSLYLQALYLSGSDDPVHDFGVDRLHLVDPEVLWGVRTDTMNPFLHGHMAARAQWLQLFSEPFTRVGAAALSLAADDHEPFDRLVCRRINGIDGELVSVVMPVFNPDQSLLTAVRSVLDQTWVDLELLLCDDGSTSGRAFIAEAVRLDSRVRLLRSDQNAGAYTAQNRGLAAARGRYITIHGADDFSHPERIQRHVAALVSTGAVATLSHCVRASARLQLTALGRSPRRVNLSSLLFERDVVLPALGGFDPVRRAADTEFIQRIKARFSAESITMLEEPLAVIQTTPNSLSRNDFGMLHRNPAREAYRVGFDGWHAQIAEGTSSALLKPAARAPFPAPSHISGSAEQRHGPVDLVFLANPMASAPIDIGRVVRACAAAGIRMALVEYFGAEDVRRPPRSASDELAKAVASGALRWVLPRETVAARAAVVLDSQALLLMPEKRLEDVHVEHLFLAATRADIANPGRLRARVGAVGTPHVHWLPADDAVARRLRERDPASSIAPAMQWHLACVPTPIAQHDRRPPHGSTNVGMVAARGVSRAARRRWAEALVPRDQRSHLQCYGRGPVELLDRPVERLTQSTTSREAFLDGIQLLIAPPLPSPQLTELIVAAWARGVVVLAEERMCPHLGDRALYPAGEPDALIAELQADPALYFDTQDRATRWVADHASPAALVRSVRSLLACADR